MPKNTNVLREFLTLSRILIENSRDIPELNATLQGFGYTPQRWAEGVALLTAAEAMVSHQLLKYGQSYQATQDVNHAWRMAERVYTKTLKIARIAFGDEPKAVTALQLQGSRKKTVTGWLDQASVFYANLIGDPSLGAPLTKFGYTAAKIAAEAVLVERVRKALHTQAKGIGEAQQATADRNRQVADLGAWVRELRALARVAFADDPQQLEKVGIVVLNAPRRRKARVAG